MTALIIGLAAVSVALVALLVAQTRQIRELRISLRILKDLDHNTEAENKRLYEQLRARDEMGQKLVEALQKANNQAAVARKILAGQRLTDTDLDDVRHLWPKEGVNVWPNYGSGVDSECRDCERRAECYSDEGRFGNGPLDTTSLIGAMAAGGSAATLTASMLTGYTSCDPAEIVPFWVRKGEQLC